MAYCREARPLALSELCFRRMLAHFSMMSWRCEMLSARRGQFGPGHADCKWYRCVLVPGLAHAVNLHSPV